MNALKRLDSGYCEALALRAAAGDRSAWTALLGHLWPVCLRIVGRSRSMGLLAGSEDHVRNVVLHMAEKLGSHHARGLQQYAPWRENHPEKGFDDWIRIVTANAVRDYVRRQMGDATTAIQPEPSPKRLLNEFRTCPLVDQLGVRPSMTAAQTARKLVDFAKARLPAEQLQALALWIEGAAFEEIAADLSLGEADAARKLVRAAVAVLRREFAMEEPG